MSITADRHTLVNLTMLTIESVLTYNVLLTAY